MNEIQAKLMEYLEAFEQAAVEIAPQALELALTITRVESIGYLVTGVVLLGITYALWRAARSLHDSNKRHAERDRHGFGSPGREMGMIGVGMLGSITGFFGLFNIFYIWNWVGAFMPEIRLARDILHKIVGS